MQSRARNVGVIFERDAPARGRGLGEGRRVHWLLQWEVHMFLALQVVLEVIRPGGPAEARPSDPAPWRPRPHLRALQEYDQLAVQDLDHEAAERQAGVNEKDAEAENRISEQRF